MPAVPYFAYGSNMDSATLGGRRGIRWSRAVAALARGWRLVLDKPSLLGTGEAMASIVEEEGAETWGVLYEISAADLEHLEFTEGVAIGHYRRVKIDVEVARAWTGAPEGRVLARTVASDRREPGIRPTVRYRDLLVTGAREHALPEYWIRALLDVDTAEESAETAALRPYFDQAMRRQD